ncbi:MAG: CoA transferase [Candidatus Brocadiia bacterium]|nr:CoA transferase [Candidatus Brocadiia bacterium]
MAERRILDGVQVLDFTHVVAGPYATRVLADLGARVTKVDPLPPDGAEGPVRGSGSASNNAGKRSIALDLRVPAGTDVAARLAARADVLVENFRPGVMARLGLAYEQLREANPRLVFASISGFGQSGASSHRRAYGATAHAEAGWLWVQQQAAGFDAPFAPGITVADIVTASNAVSAILAALYDREHTGRGQHIDVTLVESQLAMLSEVAGPALAGDSEAEWRPFRHPIHAARDGHVTINLGGPRNWQRIAEALGHPDEEMPPTPAEANAAVGSWVAGHDVADLARRMEEAGAPYGIVRSMREAVSDPYFAERGMVVRLDDPLDGKLTVIGSPLHFSDAVTGPAAAAPLAGEHSRQVLRDLGCDDAEVRSLLESRSVVQQDPPHTPSGP